MENERTIDADPVEFAFSIRRCQDQRADFMGRVQALEVARGRGLRRKRESRCNELPPGGHSGRKSYRMPRHFLQVDDITCCISCRFLSAREPPYSLTDGALAQRRKPEDEFIGRRVPQIVAARTRQLHAIRDCAVLHTNAPARAFPPHRPAPRPCRRSASPRPLAARAVKAPHVRQRSPFVSAILRPNQSRDGEERSTPAQIGVTLCD